MYKHVDDVELYVGGLIETAEVPDSMLGPVFRCIVERQFTLLKRGDRYFYDLNVKENEKAAFTISMLNEVRSVDYRRDNTIHYTATYFMIENLYIKLRGLII